jgi:two-component system OmpR family response regulator
MQNFRVLVVDDEVDFLEAFVDRLKMRGLDARGVESGEEALELLKRQEFDVVVLDVKMPGMDGVETLREMKRNWPIMEVIMLTGHASVESGIEGMKLGAYDYIMKPADIDELMEKMQQAHEKKSVHEEKIQQAKIRELTAHPRRVLDLVKEEE